MDTTEITQIEEWTCKQCGEIIFDSDTNNWKRKQSELNEKIIGKSQLLFVIEDEDGEVFGYYFNPQIDEKVRYSEADEYTFHFNIRSSNYRLQRPINYQANELWKSSHQKCCRLYSNSHRKLIRLGEIRLMKDNGMFNQSYCDLDVQSDSSSRYILCGKQRFIPQRIVVIQMK